MSDPEKSQEVLEKLAALEGDTVILSGTKVQIMVREGEIGKTVINVQNIYRA